MYPRSFLCEEAKIEQRTPLKEELCEIGEEAIWEYRFTSFFVMPEVTFKGVRFKVEGGTGRHLGLSAKIWLAAINVLRRPRQDRTQSVST